MLCLWGKRVSKSSIAAFTRIWTLTRSKHKFVFMYWIILFSGASVGIRCCRLTPRALKCRTAQRGRMQIMFWQLMLHDLAKLLTSSVTRRHPKWVISIQVHFSQGEKPNLKCHCNTIQRNNALKNWDIAGNYFKTLHPRPQGGCYIGLLFLLWRCKMKPSARAGSSRACMEAKINTAISEKTYQGFTSSQRSRRSNCI